MAGSAQHGVGARALGAGLTMAVSVALFALGGYYLDGLIGTLPLFLVIGALLGMLGGTIHLLSALAPETLPFGRRKSGDGPPPDGSKDSDPDRPGKQP